MSQADVTVGLNSHDVRRLRSIGACQQQRQNHQPKRDKNSSLSFRREFSLPPPLRGDMLAIAATAKAEQTTLAAASTPRKYFTCCARLSPEKVGICLAFLSCWHSFMKETFFLCSPIPVFLSLCVYLFTVKSLIFVRYLFSYLWKSTKFNTVWKFLVHKFCFEALESTKISFVRTSFKSKVRKWVPYGNLWLYSISTFLFFTFFLPPPPLFLSLALSLSIYLSLYLLFISLYYEVCVWIFAMHVEWSCIAVYDNYSPFFDPFSKEVTMVSYFLDSLRQYLSFSYFLLFSRTQCCLLTLLLSLESFCTAVASQLSSAGRRRTNPTRRK